MTRIAIVGLGLIGGSFGLGVKAKDDSGIEVIGFDRDERVSEMARKRGAIDSIASSMTVAARSADLIVVATPPTVVREVFVEIAPALTDKSIVTDVASTKVCIMEWASNILPSEVSFIGGHPMAGKTSHGIQNAEASLFRNRPYVVIPDSDANQSSVESIIDFIGLLGAKEYFMTADEHDHYVAATSHLLISVSTALFTLLHTNESWKELADVAGPAYYDLTRLALGDPGMSTDISITNRKQIQSWIDRYIQELVRFRDLYDQPRDQISAFFARLPATNQ